eukprot:m.40385 g.40385  ORF g.40385 m.40385 type:complete len:523 (-) comp18466_c0_seq2:486-2054(-)
MMLLLLKTFWVVVLHLIVSINAYATPPNVALIIVDDYGHTDIGYHNKLYDNLLQTPNLDLLAGNGIKLETYYVQPICTPTRSQLLSGRYQIHTGLQHGVIHPDEPYGLPTSIPLITNHLITLGYVCHKVGKWHLGFYTEDHCPWKRGFGNGPHGGGGSDYGYLGGEEDYYTHVRTPGYDFRDNGVPDHAAATSTEAPNKYSTKLFRERAVAIVTNHSRDYANVPLFLYLPFQAVHSPLQSAPFFQKQFDKNKFENNSERWTYAAMVLEMDFAVGKIVDAFKNTSLYDTTVFIVSTDNGGILGGGYNWPFRGEKATYWEGGSRAVGFVHSALLAQTGYTYNGLVHVSDWLPSIYTLAGGDASTLDGLDGYNVWDAITTNTTSPRTELLHNIDILGGTASPFGSAALRVGNMKLIVGSPGTSGHFIPPGCPATVCVPPVMPARSECKADDNTTATWLFDLSDDPYELCNLAASQPATVANMTARLMWYNATAVAPLNTAGDPASNPNNRTGVEKGSWGPWRSDL